MSSAASPSQDMECLAECSECSASSTTMSPPMMFRLLAVWGLVFFLVIALVVLALFKYNKVIKHRVKQVQDESWVFGMGSITPPNQKSRVRDASNRGSRRLSGNLKWSESANFSTTTRDSTSVSDNKSRRSSRPMPDMHAFEGDAYCSSRDRSSDDTASTNCCLRGCSTTNNPLASPKLLCPPTPVRPISCRKYSGSNSLTATKVLATCSPQSSAAITASEKQQHDSKPVVSIMSTHFDILSTLGRGAFADVYKVRSKADGRLYAIKKNRLQFRGKRDREKSLAEVKCMQRLQNAIAKPNKANPSYSLYLIFFFQAWQEEGHFFCQTELCCRDTCRDVMDSLRSQWNLAQSRYPSLRRLPADCSSGMSPVDNGRLVPEHSIWKICHDVTAGLSHIHSHGLVHFDIKPSNIFLVPHARLGAMCKIGDFGLAGEIGSSEDGQEGDQHYMAPELLSSDNKHPSADIFSLGLTLYELASSLTFALPSEGARWHELRSGCHALDIPSSRSSELIQLVQASLRPVQQERPTADSILAIDKVAAAGATCDEFLRHYIQDIEDFDRREEEQLGLLGHQDDKTPPFQVCRRVL